MATSQLPQYQTTLTAQVPRVRCDSCGVHQVEVPWAREGSGFTLLFEAMALRLIADMPVSNAAEITDRKLLFQGVLMSASVLLGIEGVQGEKG